MIFPVLYREAIPDSPSKIKNLPVVEIADKTGGCPFNAVPPLIDLNTESKQ
jgi:hypothetical protein